MYSIDTSAILDGWVRYYPPDSFPGLWTKMDELIDAGQLFATEEVLVDLKGKEDDVYKWAKQRPQLFVLHDEPIQRSVASILASHQQLVDTRRSISRADPFVIALAQVKGYAVVTGEKATNSATRPHIPDVCSALGVRSMGILELIREQGWKFRST